MSLTKYQQKRNFKQSPEPKGKLHKKAASLAFVVQRHKASRLHYDFRLEMDGVLKSWAVPKGPSLNPSDKRLAMMVEDHPYDYKDFKGVIPSGYGAGIVEIWDEGTYSDMEESDQAAAQKKLKAGLHAGNLKFKLNGKKLKGEFALVKIKDGDENSWLLIKHRDEYAVDGSYNSEADTPANSPINKWLQENKKGKPTPSKKQPTAIAPEKNETVSIGKKKLQLTNLQKPYWPDDGITKGMLIDYYQSVAPYILPYLKDRPQSLRRHPNGIGGSSFFQKDAGDDIPEWIKTVPVMAASTGKEVDYILCNDAATLAYLNNLGCIEINPWNSRVSTPDKPDYMIIDIDPSSKNNYDQVIEAALVIKSVLDKAGAVGYCKTSGATGMHIYVPMGKRYAYEQVRDFAGIICSLAAAELPFASLERNLKKRGAQLYLDYLQNSRGQTVAAPYSARPFPGATVSAPLDWKEVKAGLQPSDFTMANILKRINKKGDLFEGILGKAVDIKKCLDRLQA